MRRMSGLVALLVLSLVGCSDSNDPSSTGLSEAETSDVAEAVADEGDQSLDAVHLDRLGCAEVTDPEDSDGDGTPDAATFTFALPACSFTGFRGGTLEITGTIVVSDPTPLAADFNYQATLHDLTWRFTSPDQRRSYTAVRNGTRALSGNAGGFSLSNNITVERTYPVRAPSTVSHNLLLSFTPAAGESLVPGAPLPDGTFSRSGTFTWSRNGRSRTFVVTTVVPLEWDASCSTDRKIVAGEIRATLGDGSYISTVWTGCGEEPTRTFVPVS
ncbi:MAG TPA: hypothetical protein VG500_20190 [Gemmatimonadales bacterium]|jgi:hypothetical protein|nr:hypothetical protein [Gemmatimonadales bacterium]